MLNVLRSDFCWPLLFVCFHFSYVFLSLLCVYLGIAWNRRWIMSPRNFRACFLSCIICALLFFTIIFNIKILWMTMALATYATQISNTLTLVVCASVTTLTWIQHVLMVASVLQLTYKQRKDRKELFFLRSPNWANSKKISGEKAPLAWPFAWPSVKARWTHTCVQLCSLTIFPFLFIWIIYNFYCK